MIRLTLVCAASLLLLSPVCAGEYLREDAALPRQVERADQVVVARIRGAEPGLTPHRTILTLEVERVLKGDSVRLLQVAAAKGTSVALELRDGSGLFVLTRSEGDAAPLKLERDARSVVWLDDPEGNLALNLVEAVLRKDLRLQERAILSALQGRGGEVATDALHLLSEFDRAPTPAESAAIVLALELDPQRFRDVGLACEVLGRTKNANVQPALLATLERKDHFNAYGQLAGALRATGVESALRQLTTLPSTDLRVRARALRTLGALGDVRAAAHLIAATRDRSWRVRVQAALALGRVGGPRALGHLQALLKVESPQLRQAAGLGLVSLGRAGIQALRAQGGDVAREVLRAPVRARYALERALR